MTTNNEIVDILTEAMAINEIPMGQGLSAMQVLIAMYARNQGSYENYKKIMKNTADALKILWECPDMVL